MRKEWKQKHGRGHEETIFLDLSVHPTPSPRALGWHARLSRFLFPPPPSNIPLYGVTYGIAQCLAAVAQRCRAGSA